MPRWVDGSRARIIVIAVLTLFSVAYITKTSSAAVSGYQLNELENSVTQLNEEIQKLNTESISYSSIKNIQERVKATEMVAVGKIVHVAPVEVVAVR